MQVHGAECEEVKEYKHIKIYRNSEKLHRHKHYYLIANKHDQSILGVIFWFYKWKRYTFCPNLETEMLFERDCMQDLTYFLNELDNGKHAE